MSPEPNRLERRVNQRFVLNLPVALLFAGETYPGFTQDVSARGVFLYTEANLPDRSEVELVFTMPAEITLAENMRVRCKGKVLRTSGSQTCHRSGIAIRFDSWQYLAAEGQESAVEFLRMSGRTAATEIPRPFPR